MFQILLAPLLSLRPGRLIIFQKLVADAGEGQILRYRIARETEVRASAMLDLILIWVRKPPSAG